ncbi:hypothetical protein [Vulcanisaeta thermophila]|uniref:hypothetical protein n=1 Tax=Vulcanisaeta thermophila TaxID=867917 RepID=UPI0008539AEE|nr:hypothetical protein [Vulcanisaeta thermophila]
MNLRIILGGRIGEISPGLYKQWFTYQIRASQSLLVVSIALLIIGPLMLIFYPQLHGNFMLVGIVLFYIGIIYSQHPGFMRVMPSPPTSIVIAFLSLAWAVAYLMGLNYSVVIALVLVAFYLTLILIKGGIGLKPLYWPNTFFISGLISFAVATLLHSTYGLISLPVASIVELMRRVEGRHRYNYVIDVVYASSLPILTIFITNNVGLALMSLLTLITLGLPIRDTSKFRTVYASAYPIGSLLGRLSLLITVVLALLGYPYVDTIHMLFLGFIAVIMSSLCIPMLIPGILWFSMRFYGYVSYDIPILLLLAAITRVLYPLFNSMALATAMALTLIVYAEVAASYLSGERVKVL